MTFVVIPKDHEECDTVGHILFQLLRNKENLHQYWQK